MRVPDHEAATPADRDWRRLRRTACEFSRLLCDDGQSASYRAGTGKSQANRGVDGWPAAGLDAASRMWQGDSGTGYV